MTAEGLAEALHVAGPAGPDVAHLRLFDPFIGSWDTVWSGTDADGRSVTARGEAHFGWVLGGRAIQDTWNLPRRGEPRAEQLPVTFHGSWIRFYDASIAAWRATWMDPVNGDVLRFVVRPVDDEILMLGVDEDPQLRWRFTGIEPDSFLFRAESSRDGGTTWTVDEEMQVTRTTSPETLAETLHAAGPAGPQAEQLDLFGRFAGSWNIAWSGLAAGGETQTSRGELHFGWVLGGRVVQDTWIVPGRGEPGEGRPPFAFHGSTMRFYDPSIGAWRSTWIDPVNNRVRRFIGRPVDGEILLISDEHDPQLRWRFTDIAPDSFVWRGEISHDGGATWTLDEEMRITRR